MRLLHWKYLIAIERDLELLSSYIEFDEENYTCFSVETSRLLLAASAETDVVCKQICKAIDAKSEARKIDAYRDAIVPAHPNFACFEVELPRHSLSVVPWNGWQQRNGVPDWWSAYNQMKHERADRYQHGNLINAIMAVAGLYVATLYLYPEEARLGELTPIPQLLRPAAAHYLATSVGGFEPAIAYQL